MALAFKEYDLQCPGLPLAVYREIAAHLEQLDQVETDLLPQDAQQFDYGLSQVGWLRIRHPQGLSPADLSQLDQILAFYAQRFGAWVYRSEAAETGTPSATTS